MSNMGLGHIKAATIADFEEDSVNASYCRTYFDTALKVALAAFDWTFARKRQALTLLTEDAPPTWLYKYALPSDCLKMREIEHPTTRNPANPIPFDTGLDDAGTAKVVLTDQENAIAIYTFYQTSTALYSAEFVDYFSWVLGAYLAIPCGAGPEYERRCVAWLEKKKTEAEAMDANEAQEDKEPEGEFITGRQ